tara:strand:+ start:931 stop:1260 length:330 start_codon:yes stop_codon:yes gene_type:complete
MKELFYKKYEKQLAAAGYTVDDHGRVRNSRGDQMAMQDRFGQVSCLDPNIKKIVADADAKSIKNKVKSVAKKVTPKLKKVRARNADGTLRGDDPSTPDVNEAWTYVEDK